MNAADAVRWDHKARAGFTYKTDGVMDTWRSHHDEALLDAPWEGDCDDLTSTALVLMMQQSTLPLSHAYRLLVNAAPNYGFLFNHMVGAVRLANDTFMIVGDTFGPAYTPAFMRHQPFAYQRLDEWDGVDPIWRQGLPWA